MDGPWNGAEIQISVTSGSVRVLAWLNVKVEAGGSGPGDLSATKLMHFSNVLLLCSVGLSAFWLLVFN